MCSGGGTAVTIDLIDHAEHLGAIFSSIYLQRESLFSGTKQITISNGALIVSRKESPLKMRYITHLVTLVHQ